MNDDTICPCGTIEHPRRIDNPPGLDAIAYRAGDFTSFRDALLRVRDGERDLTNWRPSATGDLALQLVEWWAYLADILTFYNERIANDSYVRTARERLTLSRLVSLIGYRPRPAIGATGQLFATVAGAQAVTLPVGLPIQTKPPAGKPPEVFEVDAATVVHPNNSITVDVFVDVVLSGANTLFVKGATQSLRASHPVLFLRKGSKPGDFPHAFARVKTVTAKTDARGRKYRQLTFDAPIGLPAGALASEYDLLSEVWAFPEVVTVDTASPPIVKVNRQIDMSIDDVIVLASGDGTIVKLTVAAGVQPIYFDVAQPYTLVWLDPSINLSMFPGTIVLTYAWKNAGQMICDPATSVHVPVGATEIQRTLTVSPATLNFQSPATAGVGVMLKDPSGRAAPATVLSSAYEDFSTGPATFSGTVFQQYVMVMQTLSRVTVQFPPDTPVDLAGPLQLLFDLLPVSRGQRVPSEVLGSGDATRASQAFTLKKSPLTYLTTTDPVEPEGYASTLRVSVDGVAWTEVQSFNDQPPDAQVFITREDEDQKTTVTFGDGVNGARLPTGSSNVVSTYRFGGGASAPLAGTLATPMKAYPGLKSVQNPVAIGGGADPDTARLVRRYGPKSTITLGRAVSEDDYETIAGRAPGVTRARSLFAWDPKQHRALVIVYVGDDEAAVTSAKTALFAAADPLRPFTVLPATPVAASLELTLIVDRRRDPAAARTSVLEALLDPEVGLFRPEVTRIGGPIYDSWIYEACLAVPGVVAVHGLAFSHNGFTPKGQHLSGQNGYFELPEGSVDIKTEVAT